MAARDTAPAADPQGLRTDFAMLIDGTLAGGSESLEVINPATAQVFARCPAAGRPELDRAVSAARRAAGEWSRKSFEERARAIRKITAVLRGNQPVLAELLTREQGKPLAQSRDEIGRALSQAEGMAAIPIAPETLMEDAERRIELH